MVPDDLDALFLALGHRDRRKILDLVRAGPGCRIEDLCPHFETSRIAVLERADLLVSHKVGRERRLYFNVVPIQIIYDRWATEFSALWAAPVARLKYRVEEAEQERHRAPKRRKRHG